MPIVANTGMSAPLENVATVRAALRSIPTAVGPEDIRTCWYSRASCANVFVNEDGVTGDGRAAVPTIEESGRWPARRPVGTGEQGARRELPAGRDDEGHRQGVVDRIDGPWIGRLK